MPSGALRLRDSIHAERAEWNAITLLRLDLYDDTRAQTLRKVSVAEQLLVESAHPDVERQRLVAPPLDVLIDDLSERWLFVEFLGIDVSDELRERADARRSK